MPVLERAAWLSAIVKIRWSSNLSFKPLPICQLINRQFVSKYISTIGVDYGVKGIVLSGEEVKVNFWDLAGSKEYLEVRNEFYKDTQGCLLVSSIILALFWADLLISGVWRFQQEVLRWLGILVEGIEAVSAVRIVITIFDWFSNYFAKVWCQWSYHRRLRKFLRHKV
jgi:hypothetical protein